MAWCSNAVDCDVCFWTEDATAEVTESEQSSRAHMVCPSSTLPSLPSTSLLILIEVEKIQNKIYVRLEKDVLYGWISQFPF